jgi:ATP-dependent DNA ligase
MIAAPVDQLPEGSGWCYEPKWDGWRCIGYRHTDQVRLRSRSGKPLAGYFPELTRALRAQLPAGTVVDGELIIWNQASGRTSFADLQRRITTGPRIVRQAREHPATYVLFDVLADPTGALITLPLAERRRRLERLLEGAPPALQLCPQTQDLAQAREWMHTWTAAGVEGIL